MTSVQSHRQQLNGNSLWLFLLLLIAGMAGAGCNASKSAQKRPTTHEKPTTTDRPEVYNPRTGKYEPVDDPDKLVDTMSLNADKTKDPIGAETDRKGGKKALYEVAFLVPFATNQSTNFDNSDARVRRFLHYYGGVRLALQDLADEGKHIAANVFDTQNSPKEADRILQSLNTADAVVGPYETESLKNAADFANRYKIPVFSPWTPSISLDDDSPYFIQLTPGLEAHAEAIVKYIDAHFSDAKVYMVAHNDPREKSRLELFSEAHAKNHASTLYEQLIIEDASASLAKTKLAPLMEQDENTVFIMPFFSRNDEDFVNAFLRKIHADKGEGTVTVFGMPQWLSFNKLNPDYLESAHVHVSTAHFMDPADIDVKAFQKRFVEKYGALPEPAAYQGFTFTHYLGNALDKYGTAFTDKLMDGSKTLREQNFDLIPVYRNPGSERQNVPNYLENRAIEILHFQGHAFRRA